MLQATQVLRKKLIELHECLITAGLQKQAALLFERTVLTHPDAVGEADSTIAANGIDAAWSDLPCVPCASECNTVTSTRTSPLCPWNLPTVILGPGTGARSASAAKGDSVAVFGYRSPEEYWHTYFRLLRANCLTEVCNTIAGARALASMDSSAVGTPSLTKPQQQDSVKAMQRYSYRILGPPLLLLAQDNIILELKVARPAGKATMQNTKWDATDSLMVGNLVAISLSGTFAIRPGDSIIWATIVQTPSSPPNPKARVQALAVGRLHLALASEYTHGEVADICSSLLKPGLETTRAYLIESPTFFEAARFALLRLKRLEGRPSLIQDCVISGLWRTGAVPAYLAFSNIKVPSDTGELVPTPVSVEVAVRQLQTLRHSAEWPTSGGKAKGGLDASQLDAVLEAIQKPVVLIQGPPGTGTCHLVDLSSGQASLHYVVTASSCP